MGDRPRILAVDPGARRVGLALSDPLGLTAQGIDTFDRSRGDLMAHLATLIDEYDVAEVVVGHPVSMSGRPNASSRAAEALAADIERRFSLPVTLWDERLTSREARRTMTDGDAPKRAKRAKGTIDRLAAVLILQGYLDSRQQGGEAS